MLTQRNRTATLDQRLVLAHTDTEFALRTKRHLNRLGWEVYVTRSSEGARRLTRKVAPQLVVLDIDLADESGWLTCKKLSLELPDAHVILVGKELGTEHDRFAEFVGACAFVAREQGMTALAREVRSGAVSACR